MIPLHSTTPIRRFPVVTRLLLGLNVALWVYVLTLARQPGGASEFYERYAFDWTAFSAALVGGRATLDTFIPLVTHMFLHGGWLHVIGNMLYLWIFGDNVEDAMGSAPFALFYLLCGIVGAIGQGVVAPAPMVGASAAIAGVLGAYLVMFPTARISTLVFLGIFISIVELPAIIVIGMFILVQLLEALGELRIAVHPATQGIAYFAHVFGFLAGMLLLPMLRRGTATRRPRGGWG
ncbi:MAG TPA: rhomboid family intramembrane serine protease [Candidatus Limnocylindria bacterium]|nr:rhomboid family intramembrane serine protease [Candidatus Limnocylindria bacterium]